MYSNPFVLYPSDSYPWEREDYVYSKNNLWEFFIQRAVKETDLYNVLGYDPISDYGYEHDHETDDLYLYIESESGDNLLFGCDSDVFALCDTTNFDKGEKYETVYSDFLSVFKNFFNV